MMANSYYYSNTAQETTLSGSISAAATSITVAATTGFPTSYPYVLAIDYGAAAEELVSVSAAAGANLTVSRGFGGTSAQSHSLGATVRHVVNATDLSDFRTHEAATAAVHGVTGTLVGTSDTQTLASKTLTSPTVNGGALSGTFTGSPTFSGDPTFSGTVSVGTRLNTSSGSRMVQFASASDTLLYSTFIDGETVDRFQIKSEGALYWGGGSATPDVVLSRSQAGELLLGGRLLIDRASTTSDVLQSRVTGDAGIRFEIDADGRLLWGDGTSYTMDTSLYRSAADTLATGDSLSVGGGLTVTSTTWTTFTPTVSNAGTATWTTRTGYYWKLGKVVFVVIYLVVNTLGSGSSIVTVDMPSSVDRTTRQALTLHGETITVGGSTGASTIRGGECLFYPTGTGATSDRLRVTDSDGDGDNNILGSDLKSGATITIQGWYREA